MTDVDFREVCRRLRVIMKSYSAAAGREAYDPAKAGVIHDALTSVDAELSAQCVSFLYELLCRREQFRDAAALLAYAMPHVCSRDRRIQECVSHAVRAVKGMEDPEAERAVCSAATAQKLPLAFLGDPGGLPPRALFLLEVARLARAKTVIEWATGCGSNMIQCSMLASGIEWVGLDLNPNQVSHNQTAADALRRKVTFGQIGNTIFDGSADVVGLLDCMEHTAYPDEMLESAERCVKPGGFMVVAVPNGPWALWEDSYVSVSAGQHIGVERLETLAHRLTKRGELLSVREIAGPVESERNSSVVGVYIPKGVP